MNSINNQSIHGMNNQSTDITEQIEEFKQKMRSHLKAIGSSTNVLNQIDPENDENDDHKDIVEVGIIPKSDTNVEMMELPAPPNPLRVDRPFIYIIMHKPTGSALLYMPCQSASET